MFFVDDDVVTMVFTDDERMLLRQIPRLLHDIDTAVGDPGYEVLHRAVYRDDPDASRELENLVASDRWEMRSADRQIVERVGQGVATMTRQEARGFLRSLNEARLVVAARAGAFESGPGWEEMVPADRSLAAVAWLGYVQADLIQALSVE